ncbi:2-hydroxyacid dehydrogenase [Gelria sp. Kuro-4]|uniref:2-hydroxyacid dehydrogenase n=1 Tax=Gelria sp. Kuro-4 TaxID=2796927 RepID=UPI001BF15BF5|nr:phosphoglycerate dehydrogenase [Gelria sp. Kuro-4]BCV25902.1 dehydrogenase [Gelria sp. Kuro-4]
MPTIVHMDRISPELKEIFLAVLPPGFRLVTPEEPQWEVELTATRYLTVNTAPVTAAVMDRAPRLRLIHKLGAGYDNIDVAAASRRGIIVARTPGANKVSVAELVFGLALSLYRHLPALAAETRAGEWNMWRHRPYCYELAGKRLGLVGLGDIGRAVAERALAFEMEVVYYRRHPLPPEETPGIRAVSLPELLRTSDIVSLHIPLTAETRGLIGAAELRSMKPSAILINTARGSIVDEAALLTALREGWIAGAALDVVAEPPLPATSPLLALPNFLCTPHVGAATRDADTRVLKTAYANIERVERGEEPLNVVNRPAVQA